MALVGDLMDRSKIAAAVPGAVFVLAPGELVDSAVAAGAAVVVVDVSRPGAVEALAGVCALDGVRTIAFGRHTSPELLRAAREVGCEEVMPRSAFFTKVTELLGG